MFYGCSSLKEIEFSNKFNTNKVINMDYMFFNCSSLINIIGINELNTKNTINMNYIFSDLKYEWNYFYKNKIIIYVGDPERNELILFNGKFKVNVYIKMKEDYCDYSKNVFYPILIIENQGEHLKDRRELSISGSLQIKNWNKINEEKLWNRGFIIDKFLLACIDNIIDFSGFFLDCSSLTYIDLSNFDSSNVTDMSNMFSGCSSLKEIKLTNKFNTSKVIHMNSMFSGCNNLIYLDLSNFDTKNVTDMSYMFSNCSGSFLNKIKFNTSKVINMKSMFSRCNNLIYLDLSNFDTKNVTDMSHMFSDCYSLKEIIFSYKFDTSKVIHMNSMFSGCNKLISLDLSNFDYLDSIFMDNMFNNCKSLKKIQGLEKILYNHYSPDMFIGYDIKNLKRKSNESG